jgi:hypothetical protein
MITNLFSPLSFVAVFGSGIRDPRSEIWYPEKKMGKNQYPGSGINIPDPITLINQLTYCTEGGADPVHLVQSESGNQVGPDSSRKQPTHGENA